MDELFKDIYEILGVSRNIDQEELEEELETLVSEARKAEDNGQMSQRKRKMIEKSAEILRDKKERKVYDNIGHSRYVQKESIDVLKMNQSEDIKKDFYDLFGLNADADPSEIRRQTAIQMKEMHPDKNTEDSVTPKAFQTIKTAREVLTDNYRKEKYDDMGHNRFVQKELDTDLEGFTFSGRSSLLEGIDDEKEESVAADVMEFKGGSSDKDPTSNPLENDVSKVSDTNTISEAKRQRELVELRKEKMDEENEDETVDENIENTENLEEAKEGYEKIISSVVQGITGILGTRLFRMIVLIFISLGISGYMYISFGLLGGGISMFVLLCLIIIKISL